MPVASNSPIGVFNFYVLIEWSLPLSPAYMWKLPAKLQKRITLYIWVKCVWLVFFFFPSLSIIGCFSGKGTLDELNLFIPLRALVSHSSIVWRCTNILCTNLLVTRRRGSYLSGEKIISLEPQPILSLEPRHVLALESRPTLIVEGRPVPEGSNESPFVDIRQSAYILAQEDPSPLPVSSNVLTSESCFPLSPD